jgi:NTP pyrophosphatase (non-canonical NTP hydrolase)
MKSHDIQARVAEFVARHSLEIPVAFRVLDLVSETGEVAKEILKSTDYGRTSLQNNSVLQDELADAAFALICIANSLDVNLDEAIGHALEKYESRLTTRGDAGSGQ